MKRISPWKSLAVCRWAGPTAETPRPTAFCCSGLSLTRPSCAACGLASGPAGAWTLALSVRRPVLADASSSCSWAAPLSGLAGAVWVPITAALPAIPAMTMHRMAMPCLGVMFMSDPFSATDNAVNDRSGLIGPGQGVQVTCAGLKQGALGVQHLQKAKLAGLQAFAGGFKALLGGGQNRLLQRLKGLAGHPQSVRGLLQFRHQPKANRVQFVAGLF